jgi:hypothetical protein
VSRVTDIDERQHQQMSSQSHRPETQASLNSKNRRNVDEWKKVLRKKNKGGKQKKKNSFIIESRMYTEMSLTSLICFSSDAIFGAERFAFALAFSF